jgi:hypothetical protein
VMRCSSDMVWGLQLGFEIIAISECSLADAV